MNYKHTLDEVKDYVESFFDKHKNPNLAYHNLSHTRYVVAAAVQIANHYQLNEEDFFSVIAAAWFHDTGYVIEPSHHEQAGADLALKFLAELGAPDALKEKVKGVIMATKMPQSPNGLLQEIICDADLFHLGTEEFKKKSRQMREEMLLFCHKDFSKSLWRSKTIELMESHHYFTDYCRLLLNEQKEKNLEELKKKQEEKEKEEAVEPPKDETNPAPVAAVVAVDADADHKKKKSDRPERGIETMFRISSSNHQRLSDMADNKAHILITVNSIILSAIISLLLRKLDQAEFLAIPTFLLLAVSLLTMTFSILATRPSIPDGRFSVDDLRTNKVNLLFFGNFYRMSLDDYSSGMFHIMEDKDLLYGNLIRDNYSQGVILGRKYRLLRIAYNVFMFGLIISVAAFIIASLLNGK